MTPFFYLNESNIFFGFLWVGKNLFGGKREGILSSLWSMRFRVDICRVSVIIVPLSILLQDEAIKRMGRVHGWMSLAC